MTSIRHTVPIVVIATLGLVTAARGQDVLTLESPSPAILGRFGGVLEGIQDVDDDGHGDVVIGALERISDEPFAGQAHIYSGATGDLLRSIPSPNPIDFGSFSGTLADAGDVDGDSSGDILVGAVREHEDGSGFFRDGRAYLFSGASGALLRTFVSPNAESNGYFGSVAAVPDVLGDGLPEYLIGASQEDAGGVFEPGRAYLFNSATGTVLYTLESLHPEASGRFGSYVAGVPDLTGDGRGDLLVAAYNEAGEFPHAGRLYVFDGASGGLVHEIESPAPSENGGFGSYVAGASDLSGDGRGDILVPQSGVVYVFSGATGTLLYSLTSPAGGTLFGRNLTAVRDIDGDGFDDLLIPSVSEAVGEVLYSGRVYLFSGATGSLLETFESPNAVQNGGFGSAVTGVPSSPDLLIGANNEDSGILDAGRAYLFQREAPAPTELIVNDTRDLSDDDDTDDICDVDPDTAGNQCTLRAAIEVANAREGRDVVTFDIDGAGLHTIALDSALPTITDPVEIDATTQTGFAGWPVVNLDGAEAGAGVSGLHLTANACTIKGFSVYGFDRHGILVEGGTDNHLTALICGTDANATLGIGNGGDGIHIEGDAGIIIGSPGGPGFMGEGRGATPPDVTLAGNLENGIYVRDVDMAARVRERLADTPSSQREAQLGDNSTFMGNTALAFAMSILGQAVPMPNVRNGACILGGTSIVFDGNRWGGDIDNSLSIALSQGFTIQRCEFGKLTDVVENVDDIAGAGKSAISVTECTDIIIGSSSLDNPVMAIAAEEWFLDLDRSERIDVVGILTLTTLVTGEFPMDLLEEMRNGAGGIRVKDSAFTTIGGPDVPTVIANNGGPGIDVSGAGSEGFKLKAATIGTTPTGLEGVGNLGDGVCIRDSVPSFEIGVLDEYLEGSLIMAANRGNGLALLGLVFGEKTVRQIAKVMVGMAPDSAGDWHEMANDLAGICIRDAHEILLYDACVGASAEHALYLLNSSDIEVVAARVGSIRFDPEVPEDVPGVGADGIRIENCSNVQIGDLESEDPTVQIVGADGWGICTIGSSDTIVTGTYVGTGISADEILSQDMRVALANKFGGILIDGSNNMIVRRATVANNGDIDVNPTAAEIRMFEAEQVYLSELVVHIDAPFRDRQTAFAIAVEASELDGEILAIAGYGMPMTANQSRVQARALRVSLSPEHAGLEFSGSGIVALDSHLDIARSVFEANELDAILLRGTSDAVITATNILNNGGLGVNVEAQPLRGLIPPAIARLNWWGDASGPGGVGPGSGDGVSEGVDYTDWLPAPVGVAVLPETYTVEVEPGEAISSPVRYMNLLVEDDVLDVTIDDPLGWLSSSTEFSVSVAEWRAETRTMDLAVPADFDGSYVVAIQAQSQTDTGLVGQAHVVFGLEGSFVPLSASALAGDTVLDAPGEGSFAIGDTLIIDPGYADEEEIVVTGFGSIFLATPLRFAHDAGSIIAPARSVDHTTPIDPFEEGASGVPSRFAISSVRPNPSNGLGRFGLALPEPGPVTVSVFDVAGRHVGTLLDGRLEAGVHSIAFDGVGYASGVYLVRVTAMGATRTERVTVMR